LSPSKQNTSSPDQEVASVDHTPGQSSAWGVLRPASLSSTLKVRLPYRSTKIQPSQFAKTYGIESTASTADG